MPVHIHKKKLLLVLGDVVIIVLACMFSPAVRFRVLVFEPLGMPGGIAMISCIYLFCFYTGDVYGFERKFTHPRYLFRFFATSAISAGLTSVLMFLAPSMGYGRGLFVISACLISGFTFLWRLLFVHLFRRLAWGREKVLIVGAGSAAGMILEYLQTDPAYNVINALVCDGKESSSDNPGSIYGSPSLLEKAVKENGVRHLVVATEESKDGGLIEVIINCKLAGVEVYDVPSFYEHFLGRIEVEHLSDLSLVNMPIAGVRKSLYNTRIKRLISILLALAGIIIMFPTALIAAIAIKIESRGPVFFVQDRIGLNGRKFRVIKFRSMRVGTEHERQFAGNKADPRVTHVGKLLRLFRIDEIPQLWNVLKGEISLIGPRALMKEEVLEFKTKVPYFCLRHSLKPGITGWAQVNYPHGASPDDALQKLKYDLFYIKNLSPFLDFHILLRTVRVVLFREGAR